jgi:hypothetical protein
MVRLSASGHRYLQDISYKMGMLSKFGPIGNSSFSSLEGLLLVL